MKHPGHTRSAFKQDHLLQTPDTFVRMQLPGMLRATAVIHCGAALGAKFTQYTAEVEDGGILGAPGGQRFVYGIEGTAVIEIGSTQYDVGPGSFAYLPANREHRVTAKTQARLAVIEKQYIAVAGVASPEPLVGSEASTPSQALMGDEALQVRSLLPSEMAFDFAVNTMTYLPGASLSMVEIHVMEHGLLMLQGEGIYRLGESWYPVQAGDFIWMRAFCPQWFGALGKTPTKYLIYKDWNRPAQE
ncbi:MAG TPA: (S)-ureidoglycine aminohydrolase [Bryobacteraceae bacterium]|nr:(S)-ureidoglycine aminohydrolase [Bryobacteraceae bacterium]